jgi:hypothetical protein
MVCGLMYAKTYTLSRRCRVLLISACLLATTAVLELTHQHDAGPLFADCLQCQASADQAPAHDPGYQLPSGFGSRPLSPAVPAEPPLGLLAPLIRGPPPIPS